MQSIACWKLPDLCNLSGWGVLETKHQAPVVQTLDSAIHWINHYPLDNSIGFPKQLLDVVEHDIMNYQSRGLCYLPKPKAEADNSDTRV